MPNYLHRTTRQHIRSISPADLAEVQANYIRDPDLSAVAGFNTIYWTITGNVVTLKSESERDAIDAAAVETAKDAVADELDNTQAIMRAFAKVMLIEINTLRATQALPSRTLAQLKTAVRSNL